MNLDVEAMEIQENEAPISGTPTFAAGDVVWTMDGTSRQLVKVLANDHRLGDTGAYDVVTAGGSTFEVLWGRCQMTTASEAQWYLDQTFLAQAVEAKRQLQAELYVARESYEEFRKKVAKLAVERANQHGWCSVIDDILAELGLERPVLRWEVKVEVEQWFSINADSADDAQALVERAIDGIEWSGASAESEFDYNSQPEITVSQASALEDD